MASMSCSNSTLVLSSLLVIVLIMTQTQPSSSSQTQDIIYDVCHRTADPEFCVTFFNKNLPFPGASVESLAELTVRHSLINATNTGAFVRELIAKSPKPQQDIYRICEVTFQAITTEYIEIQLLFAQKNYRGVLADVEKTERPVNDCLYNVKESAELYHMALDMKLLIDMTHVIVGMLNH